MLYQAKNGSIELRGDFTNDTVWATQDQIAAIFVIDRTVVNKHIKNIYKEGELSESATCAKNAQVQTEGKRQVTREISYYNLDIILAIGYRTSSGIATQFRKWATGILKQHLTQGYTINPSRISDNYTKFQTAVADVQKLLPSGNMVSSDSILELVKSFASTWFSLESYDESRLPMVGATKRTVKLESKELYAAITVFKTELLGRNEATELFAQEKYQDGLSGIIGNVMQYAFGAEMYPSIEEKAAHLLYFIVKNHIFNDGNKRTGAFAFVWFLRRAKLANRYKITPETLTAITLLIAESKPSDKDRVVGLVLALLQ
jgi:prophage maintenance system killer protein/prophage antirepressor-like protein